MKIINPNMKLIALVCDPSRRAFSQLTMKDRRSQYRATLLKDWHFYTEL